MRIAEYITTQGQADVGDMVTIRMGHQSLSQARRILTGTGVGHRQQDKLLDYVRSILKASAEAGGAKRFQTPPHLTTSELTADLTGALSVNDFPFLD